MLDIIAKSIEEVLSILNENAEDNQEFEFDNPSDPQNSQIIEYDLTETNDPIYWSWEENNGTYSFNC